MGAFGSKGTSFGEKKSTANLSKFEEVAAPISREIEIITSKNSNLHRTRDLLLPQLLSGQVDFSRLEIEI